MGLVNKRGMIKIIEAIIAVLLVVGALLLISTQRLSKIEQDPGILLPQILNEIARNQTLREEIILSDPDNLGVEIGNIENFIGERIDIDRFDFAVKICGLEEFCVLDASLVDSSEEVYVSSRAISASVGCGNCEPRKIKLFVWRKS